MWITDSSIIRPIIHHQQRASMWTLWNRCGTSNASNRATSLIHASSSISPTATQHISYQIITLSINWALFSSLTGSHLIIISLKGHSKPERAVVSRKSWLSGLPIGPCQSVIFWRLITFQNQSHAQLHSDPGRVNYRGSQPKSENWIHAVEGSLTTWLIGGQKIVALWDLCCLIQ